MSQQEQQRGLPIWKRGGFTLVEVTLAILLVGMGVLTLFSLFPAGLKQSDNAVIDTHLALFADRALHGIRANASEVTDWAVWSDINTFRIQVVNTVLVAADGPTMLRADGLPHVVADAIKTDVDITYILTVDAVNGRPDLRYADLKVCFGSGWNEKVSQWFYTEFFFSGMP